MRARSLFPIALAAALAPTVPAAAGQTLALERFFAGRTHGEGRFVSKLLDVERRLTVEAVGVVEGRTLILTEHVTYDDGERETAVWRFERTGDGRYDGRRTRVDHIVPVRTEKGAIRMGYVAKLAGSSWRLRFEDTLSQTGPTTVVNTAKVTFAGFPIGTVEITFRKP